MEHLRYWMDQRLVLVDIVVLSLLLSVEIIGHLIELKDLIVEVLAILLVMFALLFHIIDI